MPYISWGDIGWSEHHLGGRYGTQQSIWRRKRVRSLIIIFNQIVKNGQVFEMDRESISLGSDTG